MATVRARRRYRTDTPMASTMAHQMTNRSSAPRNRATGDASSKRRKPRPHARGARRALPQEAHRCRDDLPEGQDDAGIRRHRHDLPERRSPRRLRTASPRSPGSMPARRGLHWPPRSRRPPDRSTLPAVHTRHRQPVVQTHWPSAPIGRRAPVAPQPSASRRLQRPR